MIHTCLACGTTDDDVRMALVEVPPEEQRIVDVALVVAEDSHGRPTGMEQRQVRELYANEPRCRDRKACAARVKAMDAPKPPPADVVEEGPSWMHS